MAVSEPTRGADGHRRAAPSGGAAVRLHGRAEHPDRRRDRAPPRARPLPQPAGAHAANQT